MRTLWKRIGLGAVGTVYVAMGVASARVAFLGARDREAGLPGALHFLLRQKFGSRVLFAIVVAVAGLAVVRLWEALIARRRSFVARAALFLSAVGYAVLAWTAARLLLHIRASGASFERAGAAWLLGVAGGATLLLIAGVGVMAGGAVEVFRGIFRRLGYPRGAPPRAVAPAFAAVARFGLVARGAVLGVVGYWLVRAAEESNAARIHPFGALGAFSHTALGPALAGVIALGLAAYGVYLWTLMVLQRNV